MTGGRHDEVWAHTPLDSADPSQYSQEALDGIPHQKDPLMITSSESEDEQKKEPSGTQSQSSDTGSSSTSSGSTTASSTSSLDSTSTSSTNSNQTTTSKDAPSAPNQVIAGGSQPDRKEDDSHAEQGSAVNPPRVPVSTADLDFWNSALFDSRYKVDIHRIGAGLRNLGNTCFMNATLQCLAYTPTLQNWILSKIHVTHCFIKDSCFMCALCELLPKMINGNGTVLRPQWIHSHLVDLDAELADGRMQDAQQFWIKLLEEIMQFVTRPYIIRSDGQRMRYPGQLNPESAINLLWGGFLRSQLTCTGCQSKRNRFEPMYDISVDIAGCDSILSALRQFTSSQQLDRQLQCVHCNSKQNFIKLLTIHEAPNLLVIHLKRFSSNVAKIPDIVQFDTVLDMTPFMSGHVEQPQSGTRYIFSLHGVLVHVGSALNRGHYVSYVRTANDVWHRCSDSTISDTVESHVLQQQGYMLFYDRVRCPQRSAALMNQLRANQLSLSAQDLALGPGGGHRAPDGGPQSPPQGPALDDLKEGDNVDILWNQGQTTTVIEGGDDDSKTNSHGMHTVNEQRGGAKKKGADARHFMKYLRVTVPDLHHQFTRLGINPTPFVENAWLVASVFQGWWDSTNALNIGDHGSNFMFFCVVETGHEQHTQGRGEHCHMGAKLKDGGQMHIRQYSDLNVDRDYIIYCYEHFVGNDDQRLAKYNGLSIAEDWDDAKIDELKAQGDAVQLCVRVENTIGLDSYVRFFLGWMGYSTKQLLFGLHLWGEEGIRWTLINWNFTDFCIKIATFRTDKRYSKHSANQIRKKLEYEAISEMNRNGEDVDDDHLNSEGWWRQYLKDHDTRANSGHENGDNVLSGGGAGGRNGGNRSGGHHDMDGGYGAGLDGDSVYGNGLDGGVVDVDTGGHGGGFGGGAGGVNDLNDVGDHVPSFPHDLNRPQVRKARAAAMRNPLKTSLAAYICMTDPENAWRRITEDPLLRGLLYTHNKQTHDLIAQGRILNASKESRKQQQNASKLAPLKKDFVDFDWATFLANKTAEYETGTYRYNMEHTIRVYRSTSIFLQGVLFDGDLGKVNTLLLHAKRNGAGKSALIKVVEKAVPCFNLGGRAGEIYIAAGYSPRNRIIYIDSMTDTHIGGAKGLTYPMFESLTAGDVTYFPKKFGDPIETHSEHMIITTNQNIWDFEEFKRQSEYSLGMCMQRIGYLWLPKGSFGCDLNPFWAKLKEHWNIRGSLWPKGKDGKSRKELGFKSNLPPYLRKHASEWDGYQHSGCDEDGDTLDVE